MLKRSGQCLCLLLCIIGCVSTVDIHKLAKTLKIHYDVVRNGILMYGTVSYYANITLENVGTEPISGKGWAIFFCHDTLIQPIYFNSTTNQYKGGGLILSGNVTLSHVKGCMFKFEPYSGENKMYHFISLQPGEKRNISLLSANFAISRSDMYPNFYLANENDSVIIENTKDLSYVSPFDRFEQMMRNIPNDAESVPNTPQERYQGYSFTNKDGVRFKVLPTPRATEKRQGRVTIDRSWSIDINRNQQLVGPAGYLKGKSAPFNGMKIVDKNNKAPKVIQLSINGRARLPEEGYIVEISARPPRVNIIGRTVAGVHYGIQTLLSLMATGNTVPAMKITDAPRYPYRGIQLDVARNFFPKTVIFKVLELMAMYKLNKLQLNLADEEGWRIAIPGIPELAQIGGKRCHDLEETRCLFSQLGSDPSGKGLGSGFYTAKDYKDILREAKRKNIEVIPSINFADRARAAIVSMKAYSRRTNDYSMALMDEADAPVYLSDSLYSDNAINPCLSSTYNFIDYIMKTMKQYHKEAGHPLRIFNIGGDDSPRAAWLNSTHCVNLGIMAVDPWMRIKVNYTTNLANLASRHRINLGAYEEFYSAYPTIDPKGGMLVPFSHDRYPSNTDVYVITRNAQTKLLLKRPFVFANNSYNVILSSSNFLAFDHAMEPDPNLDGDYWAARSINMSKVFGFLPDNFCCNFKPDKFNYIPTTPDAGETYGCLDDIYCDFPIQKESVSRIYSHLKGMQAQVWTTKIRTPEQLFKLLVPRIIAFAERAWHKSPWESTYKTRIDLRREFLRPDLGAKEIDFQSLLSIIGNKELPRLSKMNVYTRIPAPGARIVTVQDKSKSGKMKQFLETDSLYPGFIPQVKVFGNKWKDIPLKVDLSEIVKMITGGPKDINLPKKEHIQETLKTGKPGPSQKVENPKLPVGKQATKLPSPNIKNPKLPEGKSATTLPSPNIKNPKLPEGKSATTLPSPNIKNPKLPEGKSATTLPSPNIMNPKLPEGKSATTLPSPNIKNPKLPEGKSATTLPSPNIMNPKLPEGKSATTLPSPNVKNPKLPEGKSATTLPSPNIKNPKLRVRKAADKPTSNITVIKIRLRNEANNQFSKVSTLKLGPRKSLLQKLFEAGLWTNPQQTTRRV